MSQLSRSSDIRNCLLHVESDNDSDVWIDDPVHRSTESLTDFSSGSGELYVPNESDFSDSDEDNEQQVTESNELEPENADSNTGDVQNPNPITPIWLRAYPPEEEFNVEDEFNVRNVGLRNCPPRNSPPLSYFYLFLTQTIWNLFVNETNKYAEQEIENKRNSGNMGPFSRLQKWVAVTVPEMKRYIALIINMGLNPKNNVEKYWSTKRSQAKPFFSSVMSLNRFELLCSMFHISSQPNIQPGQPGHDVWYKVRTFLDHINRSFKKYFIPSQNISIDESMIGMKNRFAHIVYMPNKRHARFGVKKFEVVESKHSYILHTELYNGKYFLADRQDPFTQTVIMFLLRACDLLNKSYHIFTDNYYTKIPLANELLANKTYITGTVNKRSKDLSKTILNTKIPPQSSLYFRRNEILMVGYKEKKTRKPVYLISTGCHAQDLPITSRSGKVNVKPLLINKYNLNMGGVDNKDKSIYHVTCTRATRRYWKKIFYNLLDMAMFNAYILYSLNTDNPLGREEFMETLVEQLVDDNEQNEQPPPMPGPAGDQGHDLVRLPGSKMRLCTVCSTAEKKSRSHFWCPACNCGIHPHCYHKLKHFWRAVSVGRKRAAPEDDDDSQ